MKTRQRNGGQLAETIQEHLAGVLETDPVLKALVEDQMAAIRGGSQKSLTREKALKIARSSIEYIKSRPELNSEAEKLFGPVWTDALE